MQGYHKKNCTQVQWIGSTNFTRKPASTFHIKFPIPNKNLSKHPTMTLQMRLDQAEATGAPHYQMKQISINTCLLAKEQKKKKRKKEALKGRGVNCDA